MSSIRIHEVNAARPRERRAGFVAAGLALALAAWPGAASAGPRSVSGVPLPRGSRSLDESGHLYASSRGFRKTVRFFERFLDRAGIEHQAIPVYSYRGTDVARFISRQRGSAWSAIHVFRTQGQTQIYVVPQTSPLTSAQPRGKEPPP